MKHTVSPRSESIYTVTIESPFGSVLLAYRMKHGRILGNPFVVSADAGTLEGDAAAFWQSFHPCIAIEDLYLAALPDDLRELDTPAIILPLADLN
jgi:hypothetical protein